MNNNDVVQYMKINEEKLFREMRSNISYCMKVFNSDLHNNLNWARKLIKASMKEIGVFGYITEDVEMYINKIIAYLFIIVYGQHKNSNIHKYQKEVEMKAMRNTNLIIDDLYDRFLDYGREDRNREKRELLQKGHDQFFNHLKSIGVNVPKRIVVENVRQGIWYDKSTMIGIDNHFVHDVMQLKSGKKKQRYILFDLLLNKNICDSHSVTAEEIADAYEHFSNTYEKAKEITDKKDYINHWVDFCRLEYRLKYTLISNIANYMIKQNIKEFPTDADLAIALWDIVLFNNEYGNKHLSEACSILSHDISIPYYFQHSGEEEAYCFTGIKRYHEFLIIHVLSSIANEIFAPFFGYSENEDSVADMFTFCKFEFPVISSHKPICLYLDKEHKKLNHKKIKLIRKIFSVVTPPNEIKAYYGRK